MFAAINLEYIISHPPIQNFKPWYCVVDKTGREGRLRAPIYSDSNPLPLRHAAAWLKVRLQLATTEKGRQKGDAIFELETTEHMDETGGEHTNRLPWPKYLNER
jgi:hypothetical protein